jgi:hypothetical protein
MAFRLRGKPRKPVRKKRIERTYCLYCGMSVAEMLALLPEGMDLSIPTFSIDYGYDTDIEIMLSYYEQEPEEHFAARMATYEKKLATYNTWYEENKDAIEAELARREEIEQKLLAKKLRREKQKALNALREAKKKLKALENG